MEPRIENSAEKKLIGMHTIMSLSNNKVRELSQNFMSRRKEIENTIGKEVYAVDIYASDYFKNFNPGKEFEKWIAVEVNNFDIVPENMESLTIQSGLYAIFLHKGNASEGPKTFQYIFASWLPNSEYEFDGRPLLAVMGEKYKNDDPSSEEELWIPISVKKN
jgi:AraC family transcriptional regulator